MIAKRDHNFFWGSFRFRIFFLLMIMGLLPLLAGSEILAVVAEDVTYAGCFSAFRANEHDVAYVDCAGAFHLAALLLR